MKENPSILQVFVSRKMAALLLLGFSSGLPLYLTGKDPLQAWLSQEGVGLGAIAAFSLVSLPYSLKFLWAPILDRFVPPFLGRRRGWLLITQVALLLGILAMATQKPSQGLQVLAIIAVVVAFFSASQDIVVDAYRADVLEEKELGAGASTFLMAYRLALLITGGISFSLVGVLQSWQAVYVAMALLMGIGIIGSFFAPEPRLRARPPQSLYDAVTLPFLEFFQRNGTLQAILILVFIVIYKLGDSLLRNVATPFLLEKGLNFTAPELGFPKTLAIFAVIVGTLAGGAIMTKIGVNRALWIFAILQAAGNLTYFALAVVGKNYPLMVAALNIENFCAGLESAAFVAFMMSLCNQGFSATQYALLSSLQAFSRDILSAPAGTWAEATGWPTFFLITAIAALPGVILLPFFAPWNPKPVSINRPGLDEEI
ncbi:integral membrane signal transducer protein [Dulcicalothrix desertica PCC 7102]|uniref:Integral membrane signal transducer protein n=1 Tax=Dulcicalothrix desertica PCC 7102 TaxID=232991 RepID=A0A433VF29_9CYAN|nr:AmpG family muropeptide MFS transporter [Dulcicalothrix desertica]RUT04711.1 integral membrane signal transducer protein [Dulcicalothrix desertica PCC 7102]TWH42718.1 PAT family beta-lactamase induction signal transducer AmpG [Dulcicalothrix desertica PCC 7102]